MSSGNLRVIARLKARPEKVVELHIRGALARFPDLLAEDLALRRYTLVG